MINLSPSLSEINSVAWTDVYAAFQHTAANTSDVGQVASLNAGKVRPHSGRCPGVETVEPTTEWTAPSAVYVLSELDHVDMVTLLLPLCKISSGRWKRKHTPHANHRAARVYISTILAVFQRASTSVFDRLKIELDRPEKLPLPRQSTNKEDRSPLQALTIAPDFCIIAISPPAHHDLKNP